MNKEKIEMMFKLMEYEVLTEAQLNLIISFEGQFKRYGKLSEKQFEILEDIFKKAASKA